MDTPFDDNTMTIILGLGDPEMPGQHGKTEVPMPEQDAVNLIIKIKDMCCDYLERCGDCEAGRQEAPAKSDGDNPFGDSEKEE